METFDQAVEEYHAGLREFVNGQPERVRQMFSDRDDVLLCNPFRPFAKGPEEVTEATRRAGSNFVDGTIDFDRIGTFTTAELGYIVEVERFAGMIGGTQGSGSLRVTTILRPEGPGWKVSHRHADPITTPRPIESILQP
jgi:ketosteroid isomerase-like protein